MSARILFNARMLIGKQFVEGQALLIDQGRIAGLMPEHDAPTYGLHRVDLAGGMLLPGFVDIQVNGGGGVLFNSAPDIESIRAIGRAHRKYGTTNFLPTLISDDLGVVARAIAAVNEAMRLGVPGVAGIHIEGPFISEKRKGTHASAHIQRLLPEHVALLSSLHGGRTLVTLAPESTDIETISALAAAGVVVSAGHSNATYAEVRTALAHGLTGFTHLFNAMSPLQSRAPGVVGAALHDAESWCGIIVDGWHVDPAVLQIALRCKRSERFMLVTDAMPVVGSNVTEFWLQGRRIRLVGGQCLDEDGTLSGSALDMASALRNAVHMLGVGVEDAASMASANPAEFLGLGAEIGRIAPGYRANLVLLDDDLQVTESWIDGMDTSN